MSGQSPPCYMWAKHFKAFRLRPDKLKTVGEPVEDEMRSGDTASVAEPSDQVSALMAERDQLQDLVLRRQAEFENFRKRVQREQMEFAEYASMEAVKALLPSLDDFERALKAAPAEAQGDEFVKGVELVYQRMLEALKKLGLEPIDTVNQKFDPHSHHAVEMVENNEIEDHTVLDEYQRGYNFKGRLLRPAMVKVSVQK
jgi:molecular chaperone GrpE